MKNIKSLKIKSKYFEETNEIWIPYDLYTSKVQENIELFINKQYFRNRYIQKIENNIDIINKLLYDDNESIMFVAKWMRISFRIFVKHLKQYLRWIYANSIESNAKTNNKIERIKNIKGLIEVYFGVNKGRWVNERKYLISFDLVIYRSSIKTIYLLRRRNCLFNVMNYSWRKANVRPTRFLRSGLSQDRILFKNLLINLTKQNF